VPQRSLPHRDRAAVRPLLPLPLVPARNRVGICFNALIESSRGEVLSGQPEPVVTPSNSGRGQTIVRCPQCRIALWSHYAGGGPAFSFVRVGTLDNPDLLPPDIHIFTSSKQPWVILPPDVPAAAEYYDRNAHWPPQSLERRRVLLAVLAANQNEAPAR